MPATTVQRMERVLIALAEDPDSSRTEKLEALRQLAHIKGTKRKAPIGKKRPVTGILGR